MRSYVLILMLFPIVCGAQLKVSIDTAVMFNWQQIEENNISVSNNGEYIMYSSRANFKRDPLTIQCLNRNLKLSLPGITKAYFTDNSRQLIYMQGKDSLCLFDLTGN